MLWSQIKLTTSDFSDLHITGEFDNRPDTGRFLRHFSFVITYRTVPGQRRKKSTRHRRILGGFYTDETHFHVQ